MSATVVERIVAKTHRIETGCLIWTGGRNRRGYGSIYRDGKRAGVHRVMWENANGPIPDGLELDHLCRTPSCVEASHLEPVTHRENMRRGAAAQTEFRCGHPKVDANTYRRGPHRYRHCRTCALARSRDYFKARYIPVPLPTHCIHGHPFDEANTYTAPRLSKNSSAVVGTIRGCRTCNRERKQAALRGRRDALRHEAGGLDSK